MPLGLPVHGNVMETKELSYMLWDANQNGQQGNNLPTAILLPPEIIIIKIEAHTKGTEPEYQSNSLADFHAQAAATESIKIVAHVDEVHSVSAGKKKKKRPLIARCFSSWCPCNMVMDYS